MRQLEPGAPGRRTAVRSELHGWFRDLVKDRQVLPGPVQVGDFASIVSRKLAGTCAFSHGQI